MNINIVRKIMVAIGVTVAAGSITGTAFADPWHNDHWRNEHRGRGWHERRDPRYMPPPVIVAPPPRVVYAPPPAIVMPPPSGLNIILPINIR